MNSPTSQPVSLKRDLGLWAAVALVVGTVIGSGIFIVPRDMVRNVGSPGMVFVVWRGRAAGDGEGDTFIFF